MEAQLFTVSVLNELELPVQPVTVYVISVVPAATADTNPVVAFTVATAVFVLVQVPPAEPLLAYVSVAPIHKGEVPVTAPAVTTALTVNVLKAMAGPLHPATEYLISVVPNARAVTNPVDAFTEATVVFVLLQVPPAVPLLV